MLAVVAPPTPWFVLPPGCCAMDDGPAAGGCGGDGDGGCGGDDGCGGDGDGPVGLGAVVAVGQLLT